MTPIYGSFDAGINRFHRWSECAALALVIHAFGGFVVSTQWQEPEVDPEPTGAIVMELSALAVAPPDPQDLAVGPQAEEALPTPTPPEKTVQENLDLPHVQEAPLAPDPELTVPRVEPVETPEVEEETQQKTVQREQEVPETSNAASAAAAPPKVEAAPDKTVQAPSVGAKAKPSQAEVTWQKALLLHLGRHKRYPAAARSRGIQGVAKVEFKIDAAGRLVSAKVIQGSGSDLLDKEALDVLKRASPFPSPPPHPVGEQIRLALPIEFRIRR